MWRERAGRGLIPPNTGPWRRPCVSRTAALAGGTVLGGDLGNSMVSRVPATLATCPCHSPETPSGPCSPISVPVQAPPPCGRLAPCLHPFWIRRHLLGCLRATGALGSPQSSPLCTPNPSPGNILRVVLSQGSSMGLLFQLLPLKGGRSSVHPHPLPGMP